MCNLPTCILCNTKNTDSQKLKTVTIPLTLSGMEENKNELDDLTFGILSNQLHKERSISKELSVSLNALKLRYDWLKERTTKAEAKAVELSQQVNAQEQVLWILRKQLRKESMLAKLAAAFGLLAIGSALIITNIF